MIKKQLKKPIAIIGTMGAGKSTIGKKLANRLGLKFYDSDAAIETREGLSVVDIFDFKGEEYFINQERKIIPEILSYGTVVLSIGGNSFCDPLIQQIVKQNSICIWLKSDINTLYKRIKRRNTRPHFLNVPNPKEVLEDLVRTQYPTYMQADIIIESDTLETFQIIDLITLKLKALLSQQQHH